MSIGPKDTWYLYYQVNKKILYKADDKQWYKDLFCVCQPYCLDYDLDIHVCKEYNLLCVSFPLGGITELFRPGFSKAWVLV